MSTYLVVTMIRSGLLSFIFYGLALSDSGSETNSGGILNTLDSLIKWAMKEEEMYNLTKTKISKIKEQVEIIEKYIEDYKESSEKVGKNAVTSEGSARLVASNGITSYRMVFRLINYLAKLRQLFKEGHIQFETTSENQTKNEWPSEVDLNKTKLGFVRIQETLDFNFKDLPRILAEHSKLVDLLAVHCVEIGLYALDNEFYAVGFEWLEHSKWKILEENDKSVPLKQVEIYLNNAVLLHNEAFLRLDDDDLKVFEDQVNLNHTKRIKRRDVFMEVMAGDGTDLDSNNANFFALCSGQAFQKEILSCYYESKVHPVWLIGPMKYEELSRSPFVVQIHDILGPNMIGRMLSQVQGQFQGSKVTPLRDASMKVAPIESNMKTSVEAYIRSENATELEKKVELITGLEVSKPMASEPLKVVEYVFGRYVVTHKDTFAYTDEQILNPNKVQAKGDRLATVLFYLNDVGGGGATPFVNLGTFAQPLKGSAILWIQLYRNGTARNDVWHGGCPVLNGHKIIANKWMLYNAQFFKHKCSLNRYDEN